MALKPIFWRYCPAWFDLTANRHPKTMLSAFFPGIGTPYFLWKSWGSKAKASATSGTENFHGFYDIKFHVKLIIFSIHGMLTLPVIEPSLCNSLLFRTSIYVKLFFSSPFLTASKSTVPGLKQIFLIPSWTKCFIQINYNSPSSIAVVQCLMFFDWFDENEIRAREKKRVAECIMIKYLNLWKLLVDP